MNEQAKRLLDVAKEKLFNDESISRFSSLKSRLQNLLSHDEGMELERAWTQMHKEYDMQKWNEDFLKAIANEETQEEVSAERLQAAIQRVNAVQSITPSHIYTTDKTINILRQEAYKAGLLSSPFYDEEEK
jgi:hypothetical protein